MRKVLGIILVLVMFVSFTGCDEFGSGLTNVSSYSNSELQLIAFAGAFVAGFSIGIYFEAPHLVGRMITVDDDEEPSEIIWNNFDFKKVAKLLGEEFDDVLDSNVIIKSGSLLINHDTNTLLLDLTFQVKGGPNSGTFRVEAHEVNDETISLEVNGRPVSTVGLSFDDFDF